jgi:hypothetical protein
MNTNPEEDKLDDVSELRKQLEEHLAVHIQPNNS